MILFKNAEHKERWVEAVKLAECVRSDKGVIKYFSSSLFIITGIPELYERIKQHIHCGWIDFDAILDNRLSKGEKILVSLAGNLYNGGFFEEYMPSDIIAYCDEGMVELATKAILARKVGSMLNSL